MPDPRWIESEPDSTGAGRGPSELVRHLAYAEASVMLIECLMHVLIEQRVLTQEGMVEAIETALATKKQMVAEQQHPEIAAVAAGILSLLANSLAAAKLNRQPATTADDAGRPE